MQQLVEVNERLIRFTVSFYFYKKLFEAVENARLLREKEQSEDPTVSAFNRKGLAPWSPPIRKLDFSTSFYGVKALVALTLMQ